MHLTLTLTLAALFPFIHAIALPAGTLESRSENLTPYQIRNIFPGQVPSFPGIDLDIELPSYDGLVAFEDGVDLMKQKDDHTASNAFCPHPGTAFCCNSNPKTGGTICKWNGDGHLSGCELITGGESVCCSEKDCKGLEGLKGPIVTV